MTVRLFAAVVPPPTVVSALDTYVEPRRSADPDLRWVDRDNWHLTLAFFGDVAEDRSESLAAALAEVRGQPFQLGLAGSVAFPSPYAGRVLCSAVAAGGNEFKALSSRVRTAADRVGVPSDGAKQQPHLTLARRRNPGELTRWLRIVESFPQLNFDVREFSLVQSDRRPAGVRYRVRHTFRLG